MPRRASRPPTSPRPTAVESTRRIFCDALHGFADEPTLPNFERYRAASAAYDEALVRSRDVGYVRVPR